MMKYHHFIKSGSKRREEIMDKKDKEIFKSETEIAKMNSRGQITIPPVIRRKLKAGEGSLIAFEDTEEAGVIRIFTAKVEKIDVNSLEKISKEKGKVYNSAKSAIDAINNL